MLRDDASRPSLQACSNMATPISPSMCSLYWMPSPVLVSRLASRALRAWSGSEYISSPPTAADRTPVPVGNLIRLATEAESRNASAL